MQPSQQLFQNITSIIQEYYKSAVVPDYYFKTKHKVVLSATGWGSIFALYLQSKILGGTIAVNANVLLVKENM